MADEDPFAEPEDSERTVIRPNPGGRRAAVAQPTAAAPEAPAPMGEGVAHAPSRAQQSAGDDIPQTGMNRLIAAAAPLFTLMSRIRNRAQHMDPDRLRQSVVAEVRGFENRALQASVDAQHVRAARYAICAAIDDVVLNTPWGSQSNWGLQTMVGTFHRETVGGDRFYDLLARLEKDPATNIELLEFLYMCLALGFEGRLRVEQGGPDKHLQIRAGLARIIRGQRGAFEHDLSPNWKGLNKPHKPLSMWKPVWIALGTSVAFLTLGFAGLSWALSNDSERLVGQLSIIDDGAPIVLDRPAPPPPPLPQPEVKQQIEVVAGFLEEEIAEGIVSVFQDGNTLTIRIAGSGMFGSGSDKLQDRFEVPLTRVANALNEQEGPVIVVGHSDNVPIRTARFPNNMALSLARAESVMKRVAGQLSDPARMTAEGRADKEPIADNGTRDGRATNRRIEILLVRTEDL